MFDRAYSFVERYGWWLLLAGGCGALVYQKFLYAKIQDLYNNRELERQKKYDTNKQEEYRERQQRARERMQEDYARQTAEAQEREREKAQKRLDLKLGLADKDQDAETKPKRFDGLSFVREQIASKPVVLFSKSFCPFSKKAKNVLIDSLGVTSSDYTVIELDEHQHGHLIQEALLRITGGKSVPRVFLLGQFIGGGDDTERLWREGRLATMLKEANVNFVQRDL